MNDGRRVGFKIRRYHPRRPHILYQTTLGHHIVSIGIVIAIAIILTITAFHFVNPRNTFDINLISFGDILTATVNTFYRMFLAYIVSLTIAIPIALFIAGTPLTQRIFLPIADILQSVPVLTFFPVVIVFFTAYNAFEFAAIFVIFMSMLWNIVFPVIGGLQTIPDDVKSAATVFNVHGFRKFWHITLPAILPFVITGSLLAWAQGWTVVIVAEVLHTYIPHGTASQDLLGLGSLLVDSNTEGKNSVFVATLVAMILLVTFMNFLIWQPLLHFAQRFRFD